MTGNQRAALAVVNKLNDAYFLLRDLETVLSCFSADAYVAGGSTGKILNTREEICAAVAKGLAATPLVSQRKSEVLILRERHEGHVEVSVRYFLLSQQGKVVLGPFIITANCEKENAVWKIALIHSSMPGDYAEKRFLESKLQNVIDAIPGGVAIYKVSDVFETQYFSKGIPELSGYTVKEYNERIQGDAARMIHPQDTQMVVRNLRYAIEHNTTADFEFRKNHRDGTVVWVRIQAKVIGHEDGRPLLHCVFHNITARKMAEVELIKAQQEKDMLLAEYVNTVNNTPGGLVTIEVADDGEPFPVFVSRGFLNLTRMTEEQFYKLYKDSAFNGLHPEDREKVLASFKKLQKPGDHFDNTYRLVCGDGGYVWVQVTSTLAERDGARLLYTGYLDVTDSIEAQQEIKRLHDNIPGAVFRCRFTENYEVLDANDGLFEFLGYTREEFAAMGNVMAAVFYPDDLAIMMPKLTAQLRDGNTVAEIENRLVCKDGAVKWVSVKIQLLEDEREERFLYCIFVDITRQMEARQKQHLQQQTLELAIDHSNLIFWEYDVANHTAYVGQKLRTLYGIGGVVENFPEAWLGMGYIHEEDHKTYRGAFSNIDNGSMREEFSARARAFGSDKWVWMNFRCNVVCDDTGKAIRTICTAENIDRYKDLEQTFFEIMRQNGMISWKYDLVNQCVIQNSNLAGVYGRSAYEIPEILTGIKSLHPDDVEKARELSVRMRKGEREVSGKFRIYDQVSGEYAWIRISYTVLVDGDGTRKTALGSARDISREMLHRHKYEEMLLLHKSKKNPDTLLTGYCSLKEDVIKGLNDFTAQRFEARFGLVRDEFFIRFADMIADENERRQFLDTYLAKSLLADFSKGITNHNNIYYCRFDGQGEGLYVQVNVDTTLAPDKNDVMGFLTMSDMSQQVISEKIVNLVVAQEFDFIALIDIASGNVDRIIDRMGEYDHPAKGENYDARVENGLLAYVVEKEREACGKTNGLQGILKGLAAENAAYQTSYSLVNPKTGKRERKLWTFSYFDNTKKKIVLTRTDITATYIKEKEQKKHLSEALAFAEAANKAKTDFLAAMSHDIRTPMNAIIGMTELALSDIADKDQMMESLTTIKSSSAHLLSIINDILDMSHIESGKVVMVQEPFSNREEHKKIVKRITPLAEAKGLVFTHSLNIQHDLCIGDVLRFHRIVDNLLSNAIKFTPRGGTVDYSLMELPYDKPDYMMFQIAVTDSGIGMNENTKAHLFEPFFRKATIMADHIEGTGLGMSIVKSIVELKGGSIEVESEPGKGSKFIINLPVRLSDEQKRPEKAPPNAEMRNLSGVNVLLVEDHPINQKIAKKILENAGATVTAAENGKTGHEIFMRSGANEFAVILMDIQMPVMNGYEAAKAIRESSHPQAKTIPIIAMTANAFVQDIKKSLDIRMDAHLAKPIEPQKLFETLFRHISK